MVEIVDDLEAECGLHLTFGVRTAHRVYWMQASSVRDKGRWTHALHLMLSSRAA
jgi:hypothetical protein